MKKFSKIIGLTLASLGGLAIASAGLAWYKMKTDNIDLDDYDVMTDEELDDFTPSDKEHCNCCVDGCECGDCDCCQ